MEWIWGSFLLWLDGVGGGGVGLQVAVGVSGGGVGLGIFSSLVGLICAHFVKSDNTRVKE